MAKPVDGHQDDMLCYVGGDGVSEDETDHCSVEQDQPVFAAHPAARLFGVLHPGFDPGNLFAAQLVRVFYVSLNLPDLLGNPGLFITVKRRVLNVLFMLPGEEFHALAEFMPEIGRPGSFSPRLDRRNNFFPLNGHRRATRPVFQ